ncbi:hypothetical protein LINGRAHAP2_LOCUS31356 [Linum grandiflorum]
MKACMIFVPHVRNLDI